MYKRFEITQITVKGNFILQGEWVNGHIITATTLAELYNTIDIFLTSIDIEFPSGEFLYN